MDVIIFQCIHSWKELSVQCDLGEQIFVSTSKMETGIVILHHDEKVHVCMKCDKTFSQSDSYEAIYSQRDSNSGE